MMHANLFLFLSSENGWLPSLSFFTLSLASIELTAGAETRETRQRFPVDSPATCYLLFVRLDVLE